VTITYSTMDSGKNVD